LDRSVRINRNHIGRHHVHCAHCVLPLFNLTGISRFSVRSGRFSLY
jgi:hypothetical protein